MEYTFSLKSFEELNPAELYNIMRLRNEVFIVEQKCIYQDADNKDQKSFHLMVFDQGKLAAYARLLPPGVSYEEISIGRVLASPEARGKGLGKLLMLYSIQSCHHLFGPQTIKISAQVYAKSFYKSFNFVESGEIYDEDGIPHIAMIRA